MSFVLYIHLISIKTSELLLNVAKKKIFVLYSPILVVWQDTTYQTKAFTTDNHDYHTGNLLFFPQVQLSIFSNGLPAVFK
jgi:hypothetical protein